MGILLRTNNNLIKYLLFVILMITIQSCKNDEIKKYKNGILYESYYLNNNNQFDGVYKKYYKSGKIKTIHHFRNNILVDSSISYNEDSSLSDIRYYNKKDTFFCRTFKNNILESSGEGYKTRRIGYWKYYDNKGRVIKKQEFINLCGKHYMNQSWEYDEKNRIIKDRGNNYQVFIDRKIYSVGDTINLKFIYTPALGRGSHILIYVSPRISTDFCNLKDVKLDNWYSENLEINSKLTFSTKGKKNLRGFIQEYVFQKHRPENDKYLYREVYFDIPLNII